MAASKLPADSKINLEKVVFLLVDSNELSLDIMSQMVSRFGARNLMKCTSTVEARDYLAKNTVDFLLIDANMPVEDGYSLVRWLRAEPDQPNRYIPAILVAGHTPRSDVFKARDCGAHFVVSKPLSPEILLERIFWVARDQRAFIGSETYNGPDRRFKRMGPPDGMEGRRHDDLTGDIGAPAEPNLGQDEINALMKPTKVAI